MDFAVAGRTGVRLLPAAGSGPLRRRDAESRRRSTADCLGVWAADIEMDGDLDLIVGVRGAAPVVLRNNGDGTWRQLRPFPSSPACGRSRGATWMATAIPDAAMVGESGDLHVFENRQGGEFREMSLAGLSGVVALSVGDVNGGWRARSRRRSTAPGSIRRLSLGAAGLEQQTLGTWADRIDPADAGDVSRSSSRTSTTTARSIWWFQAAAARGSGWATRRTRSRPLGRGRCAAAGRERLRRRRSQRRRPARSGRTSPTGSRSRCRAAARRAITGR